MSLRRRHVCRWRSGRLKTVRRRVATAARRLRDIPRRIGSVARHIHSGPSPIGRVATGLQSMALDPRNPIACLFALPRSVWSVHSGVAIASFRLPTGGSVVLGPRVLANPRPQGNTNFNHRATLSSTAPGTSCSAMLAGTELMFVPPPKLTICEMNRSRVNKRVDVSRLKKAFAERSH